MSDTTIVEKMQEIIRGTTLNGDLVFDSDSVIIDDWRYKDLPIEGSPFALLWSPALVSNRWDSMDCPTSLWQVRVSFAWAFDDWHITRPELRKARTATVAQFNSDDNRSLDGMAGVSIEEIRDEVGNAFVEVYNRYLTPEELEEALPDYLEIPVIFEIEERTNS